MVRHCLLVTLTTSFGLGVLCRGHREFDFAWEIMIGLRALRSLVNLASCTPEHGISGAQSKIEIPKNNCNVLCACEFDLAGHLGSSSRPRELEQNEVLNMQDLSCC